MDEAVSHLILDGTLVKVRTVDEHTGVIQGIVQNGNTANVPISNGELPDVGDVIMVGNGHWSFASLDLWTTRNSVAIVNVILDDGTILLEDEYRLKLVETSSTIDVEPGNTVEYNSTDGIVRILSRESIRAQVVPKAEDAEILSAFRIDTSVGNLSFDDFGGYPAVIARARELIETQFESRQYLDQIGAQPVKGILFTGPPGTGKTYLANDLRPFSPSFISRVCPFHSPWFEMWRARWERCSPQARATGALRASARPVMSEAGGGYSHVAIVRGSCGHG